MAENKFSNLSGSLAIIGLEAEFKSVISLDGFFKVILTGECPDKPSVQYDLDEVIGKVISHAGFNNSPISPDRIGFVFSQSGPQYPNEIGPNPQNSMTWLRSQHIKDLSTSGDILTVMLSQADAWLSNGETDVVILAACDHSTTRELGSGRSNLGFDRSIHTWAEGHGTASIALKTFSRAREDGDTIYAVIRSMGITLS